METACLSLVSAFELHLPGSKLAPTAAEPSCAGGDAALLLLFTS